MINVDLKALLGRLNAYCTRALETAAGVCVSRGGYEVGVEHLLLVMIDDPDRDFQLVCQHYGVDPTRVKKALQRAVEEGKTGNPGKPVFSPILLEWFEDAWLIASVDLALAEIRSGALIAALRANPGRYAYGGWADELEAISPEAIRRELLEITAGSKEGAAALEKGSTAAAGTGEAGARGDDSALGRFTIDFTGRARNGDIDPVFCRDREIRQMIDILGRRRKNNPIAVGEAGVGKTAVVEGLALKVVEGDVPEILQGVEIYGLDLGLLQAGAGVKGEFENRLRAVIDEVKASPKPIILFIDEAHTLIGAGGPAGGGDAANLLKPALARGELRTVAATTWSEYKKYFEKDPALARRFQLVKLDEPSPDDAVTIIRGLRERYEQAHGVYVRDDAVEAAARLAARYISGRQLPDKAVDVLDTAAARVKISITAKPDQVDDRERRIRTLERELHAIQRDIDAGTRPDDGRIGELNATIAGVRTELEGLDARWQAERAEAERILDLRRTLAGGGNGQAIEGEPAAEAAAGEAAPAPSPAPEIDREALTRELDETTRRLAAMQGEDPLVHYEVAPDVVGRVIGDWTGIPVGKMVRDEARTILEFGNSLKQRIKGQDHAIDALDQGIRSAKAGLSNPSAPMGVFLLVGPSGVGKTETGLGVADLLFGGERFMVTINMSEFQEKHTVSRLIGSPPGYVGYGEGGMLTEAVRQRPYTVVLLDEVEKADPEVLNLFYQVFDKGMLSDGEGRLVDFKNTVVLMTSNLATDLLTEMGQADERPSVEEVTEAIRPVLSAHFKPALLARMEIVPYFPIMGDAMREITALKLGRLAGRMEQSQKIKLDWKPEVIEQIARRCTEVETGARNVDHIVNRTLLPRISTQILEMMGEEERPDRLEVGVGKDGDFTFAFKTGGK